MNITRDIANATSVKKTLTSISRFLKKTNKRYYIDDSELIKLREHFTCLTLNRNPEEIYSETYLDFFLKYGFSNIIKNYYLLSEIEALGLLSSTNRVIDIGSGPGVFAMALSLWRKENPLSSQQIHEVLLQDCANEFLQLFKRIRINVPFIKTSKIKISFVNELIIGHLPLEKYNPSMVVMSNSLAEMLRDPRFNVTNFVNSLITVDPVIVIIDYDYDNIRDVFNTFIKKLEKHFIEVSLYGWPLWNKELKDIDLGPLNYSFDKNKNLTSNVRFIKGIFIPKKNINKYKPALQSYIVLMYKKAWENHDINILNTLFTKDAKYIINEIRPPLIGIKAIENYWINNKLEQNAVQFFPQYITYNLNIIHCNWISIFYRIDLEKWMLLEGYFEAHIKEEKIFLFKEHFNKQLFKVKPSMGF